MSLKDVVQQTPVNKNESVDGCRLFNQGDQISENGETCERCSNELCYSSVGDLQSRLHMTQTRSYVSQPGSEAIYDSEVAVDSEEDEDFERQWQTHSKDCGWFQFRPLCLQKLSSIRFFVFVCCLLVTLQQALSSGYFNSVITTIEKRFDVPSKMSGAIASTFEIGNLCTIIFVSYFGTHRHIPVWIGKGVLITGIGSLVFALPHFLPSSVPTDRLNSSLNHPDDNMCHLTSTLPTTLPPPISSIDSSSSLLSAPPSLISSIFSTVLPSSDLLSPQPAQLLGGPFPDQFMHPFPPQPTELVYCDNEASFGSPHILIFMLAMVLIGCGGTPIFTLGTIYIDDHVRKDDSSMYIGCMYSMVAFGLVVGFLLGGYFITMHENSFGSGVVPSDLYNGHPRWIGAWWAGFVLLGILLLIIALPFFAFPRTLRKDRQRKRYTELRSTRANRIQLPPGQFLCIKCRQGADGQLHLNISGQAAYTELDKRHCPRLSLVEELQVDSIQVDPLDLNTVCTSSAANFNKHSVSVHQDRVISRLKRKSPTVNSIENVQDLCDTRFDESDRKLSNIPACMYKLLSNPIYIVTCLGSCMELCIVSGFLVFLPKYLETQFTIGKSQANLFAGGIAVPGACVGIFLGGYLLKKLQLKPKDAIQFVLFFNLVCMGLYTALYFLGCDNIKMAGATHPYFNSSHLEVFQVNLTNECNRNCDCSPNDIEPICGINGITYFSPCHAGCQLNSGPRQTQNYSNCACILEHWPNGYQPINLSIKSSIATSGPCPQACRAMLPFLVLLFVVTLVVSITQMPLLMVILRSVDEDERAFALGMQFVLFRLFGYIPSPILFGNVIDSTCLLWKANCGRQGGFCLLYNIEHFRLRYVGVCSALKVAAGLLFFLDWLLICYRNRKELQQPVQLTIGDVVNSIYTLDQQLTNALDKGNRKQSIVSVDKEFNQEFEHLNGLDSDYNSANDEEELR